MKATLLALIAAASCAHAAIATPTIPANMHAVAIDQTGGPEMLTLHTLPIPPVGGNEVLIAVHSASVASWDIQIRKSMAYINNPKYPYVLGSDGSGTVAAVGSDVTRLKVGDQV